MLQVPVLPADGMLSVRNALCQQRLVECLERGDIGHRHQGVPLREPDQPYDADLLVPSGAIAVTCFDIAVGVKPREHLLLLSVLGSKNAAHRRAHVIENRDPENPTEKQEGMHQRFEP